MEGQKEQNIPMGEEEQKKQKEYVRLEFESCSKNEEFARVVAAVFMSRLDPTLEETQDVKTAVSEAVTNAIIHGYGKETGEVFLDMTADPEEKTLTVCVTDTGAGIPDVKKAMEPLYTTDTTGERSGMGFTVMETFMDKVTVRSKEGKGTSVTMVKRLIPTATGGAR